MTTAIVGRTGSGKTYAAKGMVEGTLAAGERVCIIDPTGAWWGLRAPGAGAAFDVLIFGGDHADVPLDPTMGEKLADLIATAAVPQCVIDVSAMSGGRRTHFLTDLLETLFAKNKAPLHLVMDEADVMAPQNPMPDERRLQGAVNQIVRRGRIKGFRPIMITQRPAVLDKSVLSQIDTLVAMRLTSPQDRKAIETWVKGSADADQAAPVLASLASLPRGEGWFWAPADDVLERRQFPKIRSFDSSRTPEPGEQLAAVTSAPAGLDEIRKLLTPPEPAVLPAKGKGAASRPTSAEEIAAAEKRGYERGYDAGRAYAADMMKRISAKFVEARKVFRSLDEIITAEAAGTAFHAGAAGAHEKPQAKPSSPAPQPTSSDAMPVPAASGLTKPQARVMAALGFWTSIGFERPLREQVAAVAGYSPGSGGFNNLLGGLRAMGEIDYPEPGRVRIANFGREMDMTQEQAAASLRQVLSNPQAKIIDALLGISTPTVPRAQLADLTGYSAGSGGFNNLLGSLRTLCLIDYPAPGQVALEDWVRRVL